MLELSPHNEGSLLELLASIVYFCTSSLTCMKVIDKREQMRTIIDLRTE